MPSAMKIIGQSELSTSAFGTTLYTVPQITDLQLGVGSRFQTLITSIVLCNRNGSSNTYWIRVVPYGASAGDEHTVFNQVALTTNATDIISLGLTMESGDALDAYAGAVDLSVSVFGIETY